VLEERIARMIELDETTVVLVGEGPDGFAELRFRSSKLSGALDAYLEELYVVPELRGQGFGSALLEAAMATARERGATHIELGTAEDDVAARALYEGAGFDNRGGRPDGPVQYFYERDL
jgi:ribosomal protein S18 acetylase RimI-like enzyme